MTIHLVASARDDACWLDGAGEPFTNRTDARVCPDGQRPGLNDLMPCGTEEAGRRHAAKGEQCQVCDVSVGGPPAGMYTNWRTA